MKRLLTFILAFSMIISLVPAISASAEGNQPYQLVYHFTQVAEFRETPKECYVSGTANYMKTENVTFPKTYGLWAFCAWSGISDSENQSTGTSKSFQYRGGYAEIRTKQTGSWFAARINIPFGDAYSSDFVYRVIATSEDTEHVLTSVYVLDGTATLADVKSDIENKRIVSIAEKAETSNKTDGGEEVNVKKENLSIPAGEHILLFYIDECTADGSTEKRIRPISLTLTSGTLGDGEEYVTVPTYINKASIEKTTLEADESTSYEFSGWLNEKNMTDDETQVGYTAFDESSDIISVTNKNGCVNIDTAAKAITAEKAGEDVVTFSVTSGGKTLSKDVSVTVNPTAQEKADAAFITDDNKEENISYTASDLKGLTIDGDVIDGEPNGDGSYNLTAPEENKAGYEFVYWAKGNVAKKRILLFQTNELKNYVPDENGVTYLIPVYEDMLPSTAEYYNANGQLIPDAKDSDRPYMAGYGTASGWKQYGETNIRVAEYDNKTQPDDVRVSVEKGTGGGTVPYGDPVTCTADESNGTFRWWQKDVNGAPEIVSVDKSYTFLAYEDCTVTAVYGDSAVTVTNPVKIIIDTFGENSVMAEFIGFGNNVVEKGIMWNNNKIAMTAPGNQFTITADKTGKNTFVGYAIVKDGANYTLITDGEAEITIVE